MTPYATEDAARALLIDIQVCQRLMGKTGCSESQVRRNLKDRFAKDADDYWIIPRDCWQDVFGYPDITPACYDDDGYFQHGVMLLQNNTLVPSDAAVLEQKLEEAAARDRQTTSTCQSLTEENLRNTQKIAEFEKQIEHLHGVIEEWKNRHGVTQQQLDSAQTLLNSCKDIGGVLTDMGDIQAMQDELGKHSKWIDYLHKRLASLEDVAKTPNPEPKVEPKADEDKPAAPEIVARPVLTVIEGKPEKPLLGLF
jgi:hypothetical protein